LSEGDILEKAYRIANWKDDPWTPEGRERYLSAIKKLGRLVKHPWIAELLEDELSILDLGAGRGIGGVAFAKVLKERGSKARLVMVDIRRDAIRDALHFAKEEGIEAEAYVMNALEAYKLGKYEIILMYGATLTHFNEWNMIRLFASSTKALKENGVIVIEEIDRVNAIFEKGFRDVIFESRDPEKLSLSIHSRYDLITGSYYRTFIRLREFEAVTIPVNFRSIAHIASTLWLFTKDVDISPTGEDALYFVMGRSPRGIIDPEDLREGTTVSKRGKLWTNED